MEETAESTITLAGDFAACGNGCREAKGDDCSELQRRWGTAWGAAVNRGGLRQLGPASRSRAVALAPGSHSRQSDGLATATFAAVATPATAGSLFCSGGGR